MDTVIAGTEQTQTVTVYRAVSFLLADRTYALPLATIVQIIPMVKLTALPQTHPAVAGVMNFRSRTVPVINLRRYLALPEKPFELHTPILLVQEPTDFGERWVGLIVDEVQDVLELAPEHITSLAEVMPKGVGHGPLLQGIVHTAGDTVLLLDLEQLLAAGHAPLADPLGVPPLSTWP